MSALATTAMAQNSYNAGTVMEGQLHGTARFVGMGGAMGALGGDISTMSTNPAGIGLYRSSDVALTLGMFNPSTKAVTNGESHKDNASKFTFSQAGLVYANKIGNHTTVRYVNFGFNYRKMTNFKNKLFAEGAVPNGNSLSQNMAASVQASGLSAADYNKALNAKDYNNEKVGWLNLMGGLTQFVTGDELQNGGSHFYGWDAERSSFRSENRGGINAYDFNVAFNVNDRSYWGLTVSAYDVDFSRYSSYGENVTSSDANGNYAASMLLENWYHTYGSGVDMKLGVIFRPFEYSPFRLGLAVHTPTWYSLQDVFSARMTMLSTDGKTKNVADTRDSGYDQSYKYDLRTPWKFNLSAAYTIGTKVALGAEYEYADYSKAKFSDPDGYDDLSANTQTIKEDLKGVSSFRIGVEAKPVDNFSLRLGYNYAGAIYGKGAYKFNDPTGTRTDVDFQNNFDAHNITAGLGFSFGDFYADLAYIYSHQKADFHQYSNLIFNEADPTSKVTMVNNRALLTVGFRF